MFLHFFTKKYVFILTHERVSSVRAGIFVKKLQRKIYIFGIAKLRSGYPKAISVTDILTYQILHWISFNYFMKWFVC